MSTMNTPESHDGDTDPSVGQPYSPSSTPAAPVPLTSTLTPTATPRTLQQMPPTPPPELRQPAIPHTTTPTSPPAQRSPDVHTLTAGQAVLRNVAATTPTAPAAATQGSPTVLHPQASVQLQSAPTLLTNPSASNSTTAQSAPAPTTAPGAPNPTIAQVAPTPTTAQSAPTAQPQVSGPLFLRRCKRFYGKGEPGEWVSLWLRPQSLSAFLVVTLGLIGGIAAVKIVSKSRNGLADVSNQATMLLTFNVGQSLWWTFFPVLIFQIYTLWFAAIVSALADRQPFVELRKGDNGASSKVSVLLDYRKYPGITKPFVAFGNWHFTLSVTFLSTLIASVFLTSLTSHLFTAPTVSISASAGTRLSSTFQPGGFQGNSDLTPVLDIVSSTRVYGGSVPGWANFNYSFQSFDRPRIGSKDAGAWDFLVDTTAYSSNLQCHALERDQYSLDPHPEAGSWVFSANDSGCDWPGGPVTASPGYTYYMQTYSNVGCSPQAGLSRLFVLSAATWNPESITPSNVTVLACQTSYHQTQGRLNVTYSPSSLGFALNDFQVQSTELLDYPSKPIYFQNFEQQLHQPSIVDDTATISATDFGRIVLAYARKLAPDSYLAPDVLSNATSAIYTAAYAVMVSTFLWESAAGAEILGTSTMPVVRLITTDSIASVLLGSLAFLALVTIWIVVYVIHNESSLYEEPAGLLGSAILLWESDVNGLAARLRRQPGAINDGRVLEHAKERKRVWGKLWNRKVLQQDVREKRWKVENWNRPDLSKIVEVP
jgi:hypothetical protein